LGSENTTPTLGNLYTSFSLLNGVPPPYCGKAETMKIWLGRGICALEIEFQIIGL